MARIDYDRAAAGYAASRTMSRDAIDEWRLAVAPYFGGATAPIVDVGAGTGMWSVAFAEWFGAYVVAVEPSAGMLAQARETNRHARVAYVSGDAHRLPLRDRVGGGAWLSTVIHHFADLPAAARELSRALAPGAPLLIRGAFPGGGHLVTLFRFFPAAAAVVETFPSVAETTDAFERAGFSFEAQTTVAQRSAESLRAFAARVRLRADTTLLGIGDADFAAGLTALDAALAREDAEAPVIDRLALLAFRRGR